ncbi:hypothetical protein FRC11_005790, partial [Ceratobasidium sp. 423]
QPLANLHDCLHPSVIQLPQLAQLTNLSSPILQALAENAVAPIDNPPTLLGNPLAPIKNMPGPAETPPPTQVENPPQPDAGGPHVLGHLPAHVPAEEVPAITLVEVMGIILVLDASSLFMSLFGI